MSDDPYEILGVPRTATQDEIRKAYRKLAKTLHPDLHPDDPAKQAEFQAVSAAHDLLRDPEKRRRFDAGEIDASGHERPQRDFYHQYASGAEAGRRYGPDYGAGFGAGEGYEDMSDFFADILGRGRASRQGGFRQQIHARGPDLRYHLDVDFLDAARGGKRQVTMPDGVRLDLAIPAGLHDGQTLRLRGKGGPGIGDGTPGDAFVTVSVRPHPVFSRDGDDIEVELPVTVDEAVLGAKVEVPTISGPVTLRIPAGSSSGRRLRLKGKGIARAKGPPGDQFARLKIVLPDRPGPELEELARSWRERSDFDPRRDLRRKT